MDTLKPMVIAVILISLSMSGLYLFDVEFTLTSIVVSVTSLVGSASAICQLLVIVAHVTPSRVIR